MDAFRVLALCLLVIGMHSTELQTPFTLEFERTGGFTGIPVTVQIDSDKLSSEEVLRLKRLIEESGILTLDNAEESAESRADAFHYLIIIQDSTHTYKVVLPEVSVSEKIQPLIRYLQRKARGA